MKNYITILNQMVENLSQGIYTVWFVNILAGLYACYVIYQYAIFLKAHVIKFGGDDKVVTGRILQGFSGIMVVLMFLGADLWSMTYYSAHVLGPLDFFFYAFDIAVLRHLSEEANRFNTLTH